jgi:hypothetical protein
MKVLLVDRATLPSWPSVPSSPLVHPGTMRLLDELGLAEEEYTHPEGKVTHVILDMMGNYQAVMPTRLMQLDRNYRSLPTRCARPTPTSAARRWRSITSRLSAQCPAWRNN